MKPHFSQGAVALYLGDSFDVLRELADESIDVVVTDPPYGINFMGQAWDGKAIEEAAQREAASDRVLPARLTGSADAPNRKLVARTGSGYANRAGEAGNYDLSLGRFGDERDWTEFGGPSGSDSTRHRERGGAMHAGRYDLSPKGQRGFQAWCQGWGAECLRVLKPGGFALVFGGTRTYHRLASGLEDAGFEIRDCLAWLFGSGFPKSLDVAKAIDKTLGVEGSYGDAKTEAHAGWIDRGRMRGEDGHEGYQRPWMQDEEAVERNARQYIPGSEEAAERLGWGTALKPAHEPIVVARKPLSGTVAQTVLEHGTGAINVDACRIGFESPQDFASAIPGGAATSKESSAIGAEPDAGRDLERQDFRPIDNSAGRWPANVVLSHDPACLLVGYVEVASDGHYPATRPGGVEVGTVGHVGQEGLEERHTRGETVEEWECVPGCPIRILNEQSGHSRDGVASGRSRGFAKDRYVYSEIGSDYNGEPQGYGGEGGASRFFYCAKVSRAERNAGLEDFEAKELRWSNGDENPGAFQSDGTERAARNHHPTVKPIALMRWLVRLVTPPGGTILDPFLGSGTTGIAAALEDFGFVGIEREAEYLAIAQARIAFWQEHGDEALRVVADREVVERRREAVASSGQLDLLG